MMHLPVNESLYGYEYPIVLCCVILAIDSMRFAFPFICRPEEMSSFIPSVMQRYRQLLFPVLKLCLAVLTSLGVENKTATHQVCWSPERFHVKQMYHCRCSCDVFIAFSILKWNIKFASELSIVGIFVFVKCWILLQHICNCYQNDFISGSPVCREPRWCFCNYITRS